MHSSDQFVMFFGVVAIGVSIAAIVKGANDGNTSTENMNAVPLAVLKNDPVVRNKAPLQPSSAMSRVYRQNIRLPGSLYAGLNYGTPVLERIPASQTMIDVFTGLMDSTKQSPTVGEEAVFFLRSMPSKDVINAFNSATLSCVKPEVREEVVTIVQTSPNNTQGIYAVYAFLDKGVEWGSDMVDYCDDKGVCLTSDVYMATKRHKGE